MSHWFDEQAELRLACYSASALLPILGAGAVTLGLGPTWWIIGLVTGATVAVGSLLIDATELVA